MKYILYAFVFFSSIQVFSQTNLFELSQEKYFYEKSIIKSYSPFILQQKVGYDNPNMSDEGFGYWMTIYIIDTTAAKNKKILDLLTDTAIVKCSFSKNNDWGNSKHNDCAVGTIEIILWNKNEVILKEDFFTFITVGDIVTLPKIRTI